MTTATDPGLEDVLGRLRLATGPDRELDISICLALNYVHCIDDAPLNLRRGEYENDWLDYEVLEGRKLVDCTDCAPALTSSIDAALALVERKLPGWTWGAGNVGEDNSPWAVVTEPDEPCRDFPADAPTIPLAILTALLIALTTQEQS